MGILEHHDFIILPDGFRRGHIHRPVPAQPLHASRPCLYRPDLQKGSQQITRRLHLIRRSHKPQAQSPLHQRINGGLEALGHIDVDASVGQDGSIFRTTADTLDEIAQAWRTASAA